MAIQYKPISGLNTTSLNKLIEMSAKDLADKKYVNNAVSNVTVDTTNLATKAQVNNKVDKVAGKGLSTNDFTTEYKNKLEGINTNNLVTKTEVNQIKTDVEEIKTNGVVTETVVNTVETKINTMLSDGSLANMTIENNSVTTEKLDSATNEKLSKVDSIYTAVTDIQGTKIDCLLKDLKVTLAHNETSAALLTSSIKEHRYMVMVRNGSVGVILRLDLDPYGNGRVNFTNPSNGYAIITATGSSNKLYIYNTSDTKTWTGLVSVVDITGNTELEDYLKNNGSQVLDNPYYKGQLSDLANKIDKVVRKEMYIYSTDTEQEIYDKFRKCKDEGNYDVIFEPATYEFSAIYDSIGEELPIGGNCRYYFNNSTLIGTRSDTASNKNLLGSERHTGSYELYDGILIANDMTYVVHDEASADAEKYIRKYSNIIMKNNTINNTNTIRKCIGGGTGLHGVVYIDGCVFEGSNDVDVSYHGIDKADKAEFSLNVKNCYFKLGLRLDALGTNQKATVIYSNNNKNMNEARPTGWTVYQY